MTATLTILGIRHHGPGSARMVLRALQSLKPDAVLIEGPPDGADVISLAGHQDMKPPVALLVYEPDCPNESAYYPFAEFSPEWQAIRWALESKAEVRFIDLPFSLRPRREESAEEHEDAPVVSLPSSTSAPDSDIPTTPPIPEADRRDPLEALALAAGFSDGEAWWGRLIEERRGEENPGGVFDAIREAMASARNELGGTPHDPDEPAREAHMRKSIRAAIKQGFNNIVVVCGAWHAPVLTSELLKQIPAKSDDELLKGRTKRKIAATWIPWTNDRLSIESGYGAGIASPGWYEHLWIHHEKLPEHWLTRVARLMREQDLDATPASVIESVRLADSLAAMRGRASAGLEEFGEATLSILCHGNPLPLKVIERKLIVGDRLGAVPEEAPAVPLQRDIASFQKSLRLKVSAEEATLDLDQRKENDLARSHFLHRLSILRIDWGHLELDQRQRTSTFHEVWKLQWQPEFAVAVIEAARWGNTVEQAASACVAGRAAKAKDLGDLTALLDHVMLADLAGTIERLIERIQQLSAVASNVHHLMEALPALASVLRYGNVRKTDASLVEPVVAGLLARICVGLLPACMSMDDDAAEAMKVRIDALHASLANLDRRDFLDAWTAVLAKVGDADIHGLVAGRARRILLDAGAATSDESADRLFLALSRGNDPAAASAWLEGFLGGSGAVLVHDQRLLGIVDQWVTSLSRETFDQVCPIARRTFSTFEKPERRQIGEKLKRGSTSVSVSGTVTAESVDFCPERGSLVVPVLQLILGDSPA